MWAKLGTRVASGVIGAALLILIILYTRAWAFNIVVSIACIVSLYELVTTLGHNKKPQLAVIEYAFAVILLIILFLTKDSGIFLMPVLVAYAMLLLISAIFWHEKIKFGDVSAAFFVLIYSVMFLYHIALIREMENGKLLVFLPFLCAWMPDTFAYFSGLLFGKHKLCPNISPKKTVEGAIGGVIGCIIITMLFGLVANSVYGREVSYVLLLVLAVFCSVIAQLGDLSASLIKREYGVKDFGNLIPGHGGILDRIDSLIFVAPLVYYFLLYLPVIR